MSFLYSLISIPQIFRLKKIASKSALFYNSETIDELEKIISSRPRLAMAYLLRGQAKEGLESMDDYNFALQLNPKYQEAYYFRGHLKDFYGDKEGAFNDYTRATEADKSLTNLNRATTAHNIYYKIGLFLFSKGRYEESVEAFNKDIASNGDLSISYLERGKAKYYLMNYEDAIKDFDKDLEKLKTNKEAYKYRALSKKAIGDLEGYKSDYKFATNDIYEIQDESDNRKFIKNTKVVLKNVIPTPNSFNWEDPNSHLCPECNSRDIGKLSYGLPDFDSASFTSKLDKENIILEGCVVAEDSPLYRCKNCGTEWGYVNLSGKKNIDEKKEFIKRKVYKYMKDEVCKICDKKNISLDSAVEEYVVFDIYRIFECMRRILIGEEINEDRLDYDWIDNFSSDANDLMNKYSDLIDLMNQVSDDDIMELRIKLENNYGKRINYKNTKKENKKVLQTYYLKLVAKFLLELIESDYKKMNKFYFGFNKIKFSKFEIKNLNIGLLIQVHRLLTYPPEENRINKNSRVIKLLHDLRKTNDHILDIIKSLNYDEITSISENIFRNIHTDTIKIEPTFESFKKRLERDS